MPMNDPALSPIMDDQVQRISSYQDPIKTDFGKIKAIEVLTFKEAELERTLNGLTTFGTVGVLQILYFANYDRFVLSLNDWKYALLKRLPVTGAESSGHGPISYTFPTYNGFYTLTLPKVNHLEGLKNLETILINNTRFSYKGTENILRNSTGARSPDDRFRRLEMTPGADENYDPISTSQYPSSFDTTTDAPHSLSKGQRMKRGFKKFGFIFKRKMSRKEKNNLNNYQARDIDSIKKTNEIQAAIHHYPRREIERWITYNKEIANSLGYYAEAYQEGSSPLGESRMRGYGSVDLGQGSLSNPIPLTTGISTVRAPLEDLGYSVGQLHASAVPHKFAKTGAYSKIKWTDKMKAKIPGEHKYYGERSAMSGVPAHAHSIHPHLGPRLEEHLGTSITNPTPGLIGTSYSQVYGEPVELGPQSGQIAREEMIENTTSTNNYIPTGLATGLGMTEKRETFGTLGQDLPAEHLNRDIGSNQNIITTTAEPTVTERIEERLSGQQGIPINSVNNSAVTGNFVQESRPNFIERIEDKIEGRSTNIGSEGLVQPTFETTNLPSLSERIRNVPTTTASGLPVESLPIIGSTTGGTVGRLSPTKPSLLTRMKNAFGSNEGVNQEHIDVVRGGNAHYEA
jgi:hypothetical protein